MRRRGAVDVSERERALAEAVLSIADDAGMPDTYKQTDSRMVLAREALAEPERGAVSPADMLAEAARLITAAGQHPEAEGVGLSFSYEGLADQVREQEQTHRQAMAWRAELREAGDE